MDGSEACLLEQTPKELFIAGAWRPAHDGATVRVEDPATGLTIAEVADAGLADGRKALDAAAAAQAAWAETPARERGEVLRSAFELIMARAEDIALLLTLEMGKPLEQARAEVEYGAEFLRWFSEEAVRISGHFTVSPDGKSKLVTTKHPVGPTLVITPWNFPLAMGTRKIGPALASGCTLVVKPATQTPLTMLALASVMDKAGVPSGVLNVVVTTRNSELISDLMSDPRLRKLSFTGSTAVGQRLIRQSADQVLRVSMELGGNAPFLIFPDAEIDSAVEGAMAAKMRNMGEACTAANRFLVHRSALEEFSTKLAQRMAGQKLGRGTETGVDVGPLIDDRARNGVQALVQDAVDRGARVLTGGMAVGEHGYFFAPTVLCDVPDRAAVVNREIFGPVAPITTFDTDDEGIDLANATQYGLAAYAYTRDLRRALRVYDDLQFGMVGLNTGGISEPSAPFGGIGHSGFGREGGPEGIDEYLSVKYGRLVT